jgi:hypothetical protein
MATQLPSFQSRLDMIESFYPQVEGVKSELTRFSQEVTSYTNEKMLDIDEKEKAGLIVRINGMKDGLYSTNQKFNTSVIKKELAQYQKSLVDRSIYTRYESEVGELEKYLYHSKRVMKFIERYKQGKYTQAKVEFMLMTKQEKKVADDYSFKKDFLARERGVQESLIKQIQLEEKRINDMLVSSETAVASVENIDRELTAVKIAFNHLQKEVEKTQLKFTVDPWKMGQFSCDSKTEPAQYVRFKHLPNMIMLGNLGNQKAVLRFNSVNEAPEVVYSCKKKGQFGGCLDNTLRELCRLDNSCLGSLLAMEESYNRNVFFQNTGLALAQKLLLVKQKQLRDPTRINLIREYAKAGKLTYFSENIFYDQYTKIE